MWFYEVSISGCSIEKPHHNFLTCNNKKLKANTNFL